MCAVLGAVFGRYGHVVLLAERKTEREKENMSLFTIVNYIIVAIVHTSHILACTYSHIHNRWS